MIYLHQDLFVQQQDHHQPTDVTTIEFHPLLYGLSQLASPVLKPKLQQAIAENYSVSFEPHNWSLRYQLPHRNSIVAMVPEKKTCSESVQTPFSTLPKAISSYLKDSCPFVGTYIELCVVKNNIGKKNLTIFKNNILYSASDKEDVSLNIMSSLQSGLVEFTKICSQYVVLKNFVIESCSYFVNIFERVSSFEHLLSEDSRKKLYHSLERTFSHKFLLTLSPDKWFGLTPALIECCLETRSCRKIDLELLVSLPPDLFDIFMVESVEEIKMLFKEDRGKKPKDELVSELKRFLLLVKNNKRKVQLILSTVHLLSAKDAFDLLYVCLENKHDLHAETVASVEKKLKETKWCDKVCKGNNNNLSIYLSMTRTLNCICTK